MGIPYLRAAHALLDSSLPSLPCAMRRRDSKEPYSRPVRKEGSSMEIIYIGLGIFLVWLVRTLHKIRSRDQEEEDKKITFAKWAKEQHRSEERRVGKESK